MGLLRILEVYKVLVEHKDILQVDEDQGHYKIMAKNTKVKVKVQVEAQKKGNKDAYMQTCLKYSSLVLTIGTLLNVLTIFG